MLSPATIADLTQTELFADLGAHEKICFEDAEEIAFPAGARLYEAGRPVGYFYVMVTGTFRVLRVYGEQEVLMATGEAGSFVGDTFASPILNTMLVDVSSIFAG